MQQENKNPKKSIDIAVKENALKAILNGLTSMNADYEELEKSYYEYKIIHQGYLNGLQKRCEEMFKQLNLLRRQPRE